MRRRGNSESGSESGRERERIRIRASIAQELMGVFGTLLVAIAAWGIFIEPAYNTIIEDANASYNSTAMTNATGWVNSGAEFAYFWIVLILFVAGAAAAANNARRA